MLTHRASTDHPQMLDAKSQAALARPCDIAYHLETGDPICAFLSPMREFDESHRFSNSNRDDVSEDVSSWFCDELKSLMAFAHAFVPSTRPLIFPLPEAMMSALHLAAFADKMVSSTYLCPQEISFELTDSSLVCHSEEAMELIQAFRRRGFRLSVDARKCWQAEFPAYIWLMIDTLRVDQVSLGLDAHLDEYVERAADAGVSIIATRPAWRESQYLGTYGVDYGVSPRADA